MTVRRPVPDGNTNGGNSGLPEGDPPQALISLRAAVVLVSSLLLGAAAGILTYFPVHNLAEATLAGLTACAGAIKFLDALIA